jgi:hypothetical protein
MPGNTMSENGTRQLILAVTVAGVPTGTPKAAAPITTDRSMQTSPAVDNDAEAAD